MLLSSVSSSVARQLFEKNILYMMIIIYLYQILGKKQHISSINNHNVILVIMKNYESLQDTSRYHIFVIFISNILLLDFSFTARNFNQLQCFGTIVFHISCFFESLKKIYYLSNISQLFLKKELKTTKKQSKIAKQKAFINKIITIFFFIIGLIFIYISYFENLIEIKQHLSILKDLAKNMKKPKIYPIMPLLWLNDNDVIYNVGLGCESERIDQGRSYYNENISISNCFFTRSLSYSGIGGVIYVNGGSYSMNINYSMFYNCVCFGNGGAIYFFSSNSYLRMICANSCSCGAYYFGHFAYLIASQVNHMEYLSVSNCSHTTSGYRSIHLYTGNQKADGTNSSMNNAYWGSGICIDYPSSFTSSHCTFSNNKVSDSICMYFYSTSGTISMSYSNIVHNNCPNAYNGVVFVEGAGSRKMMYSIFLNNQNTLFCVYEGSLEVSHSFIYHSASFSTRTAVSTSNNNSFTNTITYQLQFFESYYCNVELPVPVPSQMSTPTFAPTKTFEKSPIRSLEETKRITNVETLRMTYESTIDQTIRETIMNTPEDTLMNTLEITLFNTLEETPLNTPEDTPLNTPEETPLNTLEDTLFNTPEETPSNTLEDTLFNTLEDTPLSTPEDTSLNTPEDTLFNTPEEIPLNTPEDTLFNTPEETPLNTLEQSPINAINQTIRETAKETIHRSYDESRCSNQMANRREISVVFAFLFQAIILMIS